MQARTLHTWIARHIAVRTRLAQVSVSYLLFLMVVTRQHSLEEAARFSGGHKSPCSKFLRTHSPVAITALQHLSTKQAKRVSKTLHHLSQQQLPWKIALLIDRPLQHRASLHPENAKKFNHGTGFVIGHPWTNIVLIIHEILIPLPPIPFYSKRYCRAHALTYPTEQDLVVASINT
jgi:hypothetical protein